MKLYVSTITGIKRFFLISSSNSVSTASGKASTLAAPICRRFSSGTLLLPLLLLLLLLLLLGIVFPFLFVKITFSVLQSPPPGLGDYLVWRILGGIDPSNASPHNIYIGKNAKLRGLGVGLDCGYKYKRLFIRGSVGNSKLREELIRAFVEANEGGTNENDLRVPTESFDELVRQMASNPLDIKDFAFGTKAMLLRMEHKVNSARRREEIYWHLASHGVPKSLHCVCLKLAEQYAMNSVARSHLPPPEYASHLTSPSFHHVVLLTDNVLAASVVVSSAVQNSVNPEKMVFHIVTDKKTYTPMHAWFAINPIESAVVEVKGLHQYDWSEDVNSGVQDMLEIQRLIWSHYYNKLKEENFQHVGELKRILEALRPSILSLLNHLRIYIPELFPDLNKIVFLDDDVVVQHDISALWEFDLNKKVVGAVANSWCGENCCPGRRYRNYLNFSHSIISSNFDADRCAWLYGMNIFDLEAWRKTNITKNYHQWLKLNLNSGLELWQPGVLPPALLAFEGYVQPIDPLWHVAGLGYAPPEAHEEILETAAVLHFSGPAKPWLVIGSPEVRNIWTRHINLSNNILRKCTFMD